LAANEKKKYGSVEDLFILCETCYYWCALHIFDKSRLPTEKCLICLNTEMSSFRPILPNETFTFNYNDKRGIELEFRPRRKNKEEQVKANTIR
jgi:hypothetical protein